MNPYTSSSSRRNFLKKSTAVMVGSALAGPFILRQKTAAAVNQETLRVGLIGCGGRGTGAATQALTADKNIVLTAMGDAFSDRLQNSLKSLKADETVGSKVQVDPDHCFIGFDAYQKVLASGIDVVILATPPGFRPQHLKAAVAAGKHIFCEKPMATDAPGVRSVLESVAEAKKKNLSLVAGFCYRYSDGERGFFQRVHDGALGEIRAIQTTYNTGPIWSHERKPDWTDMQWQMRNWYYFTWLSGDHIVEQAVHSIDKMAWAMKDVPPAKATALGGRQVRTAPVFGHIYDHFSVVYEYADGTRAFHFCRQQANCASDNSDYILGSKGTGHVIAFGPLTIEGEKSWRFTPGPQHRNMYQIEHDELFASIRAGKPMNDGVRMAHSTLLAIMGRMSAYTGQVITWEQAMQSKESLIPERLDWDVALEVPPVAIPGKTKFV